MSVGRVSLHFGAVESPLGARPVFRYSFGVFLKQLMPDMELMEFTCENGKDYLHLVDWSFRKGRPPRASCQG